MAPKQNTTLPPASLTVERIAEGATELPALVVLWSRHEPHRIGEVLLVPDGGSAEPWTFGRGEAAAGERRLVLFRQRPRMLEAQGPLACPRISRVQLRISSSADVPGTLSVENAGRSAILLDGRAIQHSTLHLGDVIELENELLLLRTTRPARLPESVYARPSHRFGEPDAHGLIGESPAMWMLRNAITAAARRTVHTIVFGPSGSGKELVARALHAESERSARPLVARNAATIPEGLADAELFGNIRNYPNPGTPDRTGLIGQADGSTLFLDEIAELPASMQAHLLRVLDEGEYQRLGDARSRRSDFRLVGATNRPQSYLKHDMLARFKLHLNAPGLDERREDIPLIATHLLQYHAAIDPMIAERFFPDASVQGWPRLSPALVRALVRHRYTTHVRELDALLLAAALESTGRYVDLTDGVRLRLEADPAQAPANTGAELFTPDEQRRLQLQRRHRFRAAECGRDPEYPGNRQTADLHLRQLICKALQAAAWDVAQAAVLLSRGGDDDLRSRARARVDTFLANLERRLSLHGDQPPDEARRQELIEEWRGNAELLAPLLDALQAGCIRGRGSA